MYTFTYRRHLWPFKRTIKHALAHSYNRETDKMWVLLEDGGIEIVKWSACAVSFGKDWKAHMEHLEAERLKREAKAE